MCRLSKIKRIITLFCCTLLLSMSIFMSYNTAVHAVDDYDLKDAIEDIINVALVVGGIVSIPASGGLTALGFLSILGGLLGATDSIENIQNYITDNGDGTYTIDESLIQAVMDAAEELDKQGFNNYHALKNSLGNYVYHGAETFTQGNYVYSVTYSYEGTERLVCAGGWICDIDNDFDSVRITYKFYNNGNCESISSKPSTFHWFNDSNLSNYALGMNMPLYNTVQDAKSAYEKNDYSDALNYREKPIFRRHSSYTPTYTGGPVTVHRTVIDNINSEITKVDADDSLSDDQKIEILQQYIFSGGASITPTPPPAPSDPDYDDNKDLPSGTDLTDTNSWLKKIYLKVCQIYAKMNAAVEDAEDAALAKIQESLDEIIVQLKKIKHWAAVDTVIDGVDAVADWLDLIYDVLKNGAGSAVTALSSALEDSTDLMKQKFPFSIPWDILFFVSVLSAEPETPHFEIPFNFEYPALDLAVDYTMELDFTPLQWLSDLSRLLLSMTYAVGLIKKTLDIVSANKEG